jgi:hypothetical protein
MATNDQKPIDGYTLVHFLVGYLARKHGASYPMIIVGSIVYELLEDKIIDSFTLSKIGWDKESKKNAIVDIAAALLGARMVKWLFVKSV